MIKNCAQCGKEFKPEKPAGKYCSCKCAGARYRKPFNEQYMMDLRAQGWGFKRIGKAMGIDPMTIRNRLMELPDYKPMQSWNKGLKGVICNIPNASFELRAAETNPDKLIMAEYRRETGKLRRYDELKHWGNHPCVLAFQQNLYYHALSKEEKRRKFKLQNECRNRNPERKRRHLEYLRAYKRSERGLAYAREYMARYLDRDGLGDRYIRSLLRSNTTLKLNDFPQELVEVKRKQIELKRLISPNKYNENKNHERHPRNSL